MVGDGPDRERLEQLAHDLGIARSTYFVGYQEDVAGYYRLFDAFLLPSVNEGTPVSAIEALASGNARGRDARRAACPTSCATESTASSSSRATSRQPRSGSRALARDPELRERLGDGRRARTSASATRSRGSSTTSTVSTARCSPRRAFRFPARSSDASRRSRRGTCPRKSASGVRRRMWRSTRGERCSTYQTSSSIRSAHGQLRAAVHLRPAGEPRPDVEPVALVLVVLVDLVAQRRARPDDAHVAAQDVPELRQLVDGRAPEDAPDARDPAVAPVDRVPRARCPRRRRPSCGASAPRSRPVLADAGLPVERPGHRPRASSRAPRARGAGS